MTEDKTLAARFFFRNCAVSIHVHGEMRISRTLKPGPDDVVLDRDFTPANSPSEFIGRKSDFYRFLDASSLTNASIIKKLTAIGYMLCNKLPRGGRRHRAFICVNEDKGAYENGKTLFAQSIAQFCRTSFVDACQTDDPFWLSPVEEKTNLLIIDDMPSYFDFSEIFILCTDAWSIPCKGQPRLVIPREKAPYILIPSANTADMFRKDGSFLRRFTLLEFSSFFGPENTIRNFIGRDMFLEWDKSQWHMFDNFMFYCVLEYLREDYSKGYDTFSFYE